MQNWERFLKEETLESILYKLAKIRIDNLNGDNYDKESFMFRCDDGNQYYWLEDAEKYELEWLKREVEE